LSQAVEIIRKYYAASRYLVSNSNAARAYLPCCNRLIPPLSWRCACRSIDMQDILWIGLVLTLLGASLGYAALCDQA